MVMIRRKSTQIMSKKIYNSYFYERCFCENLAVFIPGYLSIKACLQNVLCVLCKGRKEDPGNYMPVSLTLVSQEVMEQIILSAITWNTACILSPKKKYK